MSKTITINCEDELTAVAVKKFFTEQKESIAQLVDNSLRQEKELSDASIQVQDSEIKVSRTSNEKGGVLFMDKDSSSLISRPFNELSTGDRYITLTRGNLVAYERLEGDVDYLLGMFQSVDAAVKLISSEELDEQILEVKKQRVSMQAIKAETSKVEKEKEVEVGQ